MREGYLEVGKVLITLGIRGVMKVLSWGAELEDLGGLETVYISGKAYTVKHTRIHGQVVLMTLEGVSSIDDALTLKNKIVEASREDFLLDEGEHFVVDLIGLEARNWETGEVLGKVAEIMEYPAQDIYVIKGEKQIMIPDVPDFVKEINEEEGYIAFRLLEGMV